MNWTPLLKEIGWYFLWILAIVLNVTGIYFLFKWRKHPKKRSPYRTRRHVDPEI